jgi:hypothetical protein
MPQTPSTGYNVGMKTAENPTPAPEFAAAGSFLEALAAADFPGLKTVFDEDATLSALLPRGFKQWRGAAEIAATFERWFGDAEACELVDGSLGQVGSRLQLRWQLRLRAERLGGRRFVEQYAYADTLSTGRIHNMALLCSGFCDEHLDG